MEWNYLRRMGMAMCLFLLVGFTACDDDEDEMAGIFNSDQFYDRFSASERFNDWDDNEDEVFDDSEFNTSHYETWDVNDDNFINEDEFNNAVNDFQVTDAEWSTWDTNENNQLDATEFNSGFDAYNYYDDWDADADGFISDREYSDGIFDSWDHDNDGLLIAEEYDTFNNRYFNM